MKISEAIAQLTKIQQEHGDLEILDIELCNLDYCERCPTQEVSIEIEEHPERKGEKMVRFTQIIC